MSGFNLGQRVRYTHELHRARVQLREIAVTEKYGDREVEHQRPINKEWLPLARLQPIEGIVVGKRTLSNGHSYFESGYDTYFGAEQGGNWIWEPAESFTAWLVVKDLHSKPVHVLPEHITAIAEVGA